MVQEQVAFCCEICGSLYWGETAAMLCEERCKDKKNGG